MSEWNARKRRSVVCIIEIALLPPEVLWWWWYRWIIVLPFSIAIPLGGQYLLFSLSLCISFSNLDRWSCAGADFLQLTNLGAWQAGFVREKLSWVNFAVNTKQIERKNWFAGSSGGILDPVRENPTHASLWGRVEEENISEIPDNKYFQPPTVREFCHQLLTDLLLPLPSKWPRDYLNRSFSGNSSQSKIF